MIRREVEDEKGERRKVEGDEEAKKIQRRMKQKQH